MLIVVNSLLTSDSVADIGLHPGFVEKQLERYFQLANKWEAILLFDEADIFLEERLSERLGDMERNSVVSGMYSNPVGRLVAH